MDKTTIEILKQSTARFYAVHAEAFSATRQSPWQGWTQLVEPLRACVHDGELSVLDVGCGNMRFARFLADELPDVRIDYRGLDVCDELACADAPFGARYCKLDVMEAVQNGAFTESLAQATFDVVVAFGFMHHVPGSDLRMDVVHALAECVRLSGLLALSLWRFARDERMLMRAEETTRNSVARLGNLALEQGDYLLGWDGSEQELRYCHSFSDEDVQQLSAVLAASPCCASVDAYDADGRTGNLNTYLVCRFA